MLKHFEVQEEVSTTPCQTDQINCLEAPLKNGLHQFFMQHGQSTATTTTTHRHTETKETQDRTIFQIYLYWTDHQRLRRLTSRPRKYKESKEKMGSSIASTKMRWNIQIRDMGSTIRKRFHKQCSTRQMMRRFIHPDLENAGESDRISSLSLARTINAVIELLSQGRVWGRPKMGPCWVSTPSTPSVGQDSGTLQSHHPISYVNTRVKEPQVMRTKVQRYTN
jgi:hypothetical protein